MPNTVFLEGPNLCLEIEQVTSQMIGYNIFIIIIEQIILLIEVSSMVIQFVYL